MTGITRRAHRLRLLLSGLFFLFTMLFIFYMSGQNGVDSADLSDRFLETGLGRLMDMLLPMLSDDAYMSIRKHAHIIEYFFLGISSFLFFYELFWEKAQRLYKTLLCASVWSFLYACSDEWHQSFVPERAGSFSDVRFDAAGFLAGIVLLFGIVWLKTRKESA